MKTSLPPPREPRSARPRRRAVAVALAFGQLAIACASTARQPEIASPIPASSLSAEISSPAGAATVPGEAPGPGDTADPSGPRVGGAGQGSATSPPPAGTPVRPDRQQASVKDAPPLRQAAPSGPGVTADTITIGLPLARANDELQEQAQEVSGFTFTPLNIERVIRLLVEDLNARGGLLGREVRLDVWRYDSTDYPRLADYIAAECAHFTQDVKVFTVLIFSGDLETADCYLRAGMPLILPGGNIMGDREYARYPHTFTMAYPNLNRYARMMVHGLADEGFLSRGSRAGVVTFDSPGFTAAFEDALKPALAARGVSLVADAHVTAPKDLELYGLMVTDVNNAVVRFRAERVEKVLFLDLHGNLAAQFTRAAENQQYRGFEYGLTSASGGDWRDEAGERFLPAGQMGGAVLIGWAPLGDIPQAQGYAYLPPSADRCRELLERGGFRFDRDNCCKLWVSLETCERVWFLEAALEAPPGGTSINLGSFIRGAESLGSSFEPASTLGVTFGKGKHDGPAVYRVARWFPECECFRYTTDELRMP